MLSFWEYKEEARPDFSTIVSTLSNYLESTSDYLNLNAALDKELMHSASGKNKDSAKHTSATSSSGKNAERTINRILSNPNDYYQPGSSV